MFKIMSLDMDAKAVAAIIALIGVLYVINRLHTKLQFVTNIQTYFMKKKFTFFPINIFGSNKYTAQLYHLPSISTVTFFEGSQKEAADHLQTRCDELLEANPWLLGKLMWIKDTMILTFPSQDFSNYTFYREVDLTLLNAAVKVSRDMPYDQMVRKLSPFLVDKGDGMYDSLAPLFKVTLVTISTSKKDLKDWAEFALVVSMSPQLGDVKTFYAVCDMLSLSSARNGQEEEEEETAAATTTTTTGGGGGRTQSEGVVKKLPFSPPFAIDGNDPATVLNVIPAAAPSLWRRWKVKLALDGSDVMQSGAAAAVAAAPGATTRRKVHTRICEVDSQSLNTQCEKSLSERDVVLGKREEKKDKDKDGRQKSVADSAVVVQHVSATSVISSWFFNLTNCAIGFIGVDGRMTEMKKAAATADEKLKEKLKIPFAGSFFNMLHFEGKAAYKHPLLIESSRAALLSSRDAALKGRLLGHGKQSAAFFCDWSTFSNQPVKFGPSSQVLLHLPLVAMDAATEKMVSDIAIVFNPHRDSNSTGSNSDCGTSNSNNNSNKKKKVGCRGENDEKKNKNKNNEKKLAVLLLCTSLGDVELSGQELLGPRLML